MKHKPIRDLDRFASVRSPTATKADLRWLPVFARHDRFFDSFEENVPALRQMVLGLVAWLREVMEYERSINILGL